MKEDNRLIREVNELFEKGWAFHDAKDYVVSRELDRIEAKYERLRLRSQAGCVPFLLVCGVLVLTIFALIP